MKDADPQRSVEPFISARGLSLRTRQGCPFADVDLDAFSGEVLAVRGRAGSGKSALILTLAGRMKPSSGELRVAGLPLPRARRRVQRLVGLSIFKGVSEPPLNASVASVAAAELGIWRKPSNADAVAAYLRSWNLAELAYAQVKDLDAERRAVLGLALGMAGSPAALVVDDIEEGLLDLQSASLMDRLLALSRDEGLAVVVGCVSRKLAAGADHVFNLV